MFATESPRNSIFRSGARYVLLGLSAFVILGLLVIFMPERLAFWSDFRAGNRIISSVESFKRVHNRLPASLEEMKIEEESVYYCKTKTEGQYIVWFTTSLDESKTFDSRTGKWSDFGEVCGD